MQTIIYNPRVGSDIKNFRWLGGIWDLEVNTMAKFPEEVAEELLKRFPFLQEVKPEGIEDVLKTMKSEVFKCPHCKYEVTSEKQLRAHIMGKHKVTKEVEEILDKIPEAKVQMVQKVQKKPKSQEEMMKDGYDGWVGPGEEDDLLDIGLKKPGMPGVF